MNMTFVSSSNLKAVGYDSSSQTLRIEFNNGSIYDYYAIPASLYLGLMSASSHGSYLDRNIKKAGYRHHQIR
jgi:hypothetical protein